jgi:hypothetical protein
MILTTVGLCLVLAFGAAWAAGRGRDTSADRTKRGGTDAVSTGVVVDEQSDLFGNGILMNRVAHSSNGANKGRSLLSAAVNAEGDQAIGLLNQILALEIPENEAGDKLLANTYSALANLHGNTSSKQVHYLGLALRHTSNPGVRTRLQNQITTLGGDAVAFAFERSGITATSNRTPGHADTCGSLDNGVVTMTAAGDSFTDSGVDIDHTVADEDWYTIDIATGDPAVGLELHIETCTDNPGTLEDDTDIWFYAACGDPSLYFGGDGGCNDSYMSEIDTGCLGDGTYYLEVEGWLSTFAGALNIDVNISATASCVIPLPDTYEPDNDKVDATPFGHEKPYNKPDALTGGHAALDIQAHNIFPAGDVDLMSFRLKESAWVDFETANCFPTIFNGFDPACNTGVGMPDTVLSIHYPFFNFMGGLCNQQTFQDSFTIIGPGCLDDSYCDLDGDGLVFPDDDDLIFPIAGFPACLPWELFGRPERNEDNPLAENDDKASGGLSSALTLCLPRTTRNSPDTSVEDHQPDFSWYLKVRPFGSAATFDYEVFMHNREKCHFELEPNGGFATSASAKSKKKNENNHLVIGETISGIHDWRKRVGADNDLFDFDVTEETRLIIEMDGYDSNAVDGYMEIFVGPDGAGDYFTTSVSGEDNGPGWLPAIDVILPPSCELLGVECPDPTTGKGKKGKGKGKHNEGPSYWLLATSNYTQPNYPYDIYTTTAVIPEVEVGDLPGDCDGGEAAAALGQTWIADLTGLCDYDAYKVSLTTNTDIDFRTVGRDTIMQLVDCDTDAVLGCDDDSSPGGGFASQIAGCLAGPGDYCVRIRGWGSTTGGYVLELNGTEGCTVTGPLSSDYSGACSDFPSSAGFDSCP